jgi:hypothetical protein
VVIVQTYKSPFARWSEQSSVRTMAVNNGQWRHDAAGNWFPVADWRAVINHPEVAGAGRQQQVLAAMLLGYLDFTIRLEASCIAPVCRDLAMRRLAADCGAEVVRDALRVQCDEAFHALMCEELSEHASQVTGLDPRGFPEHTFFRRVRELASHTHGLMSEEQYTFCVAVVAETVITDSLGKDWRDDGLRPEVRDVLLNHYKDEVRHSAFFSQLLGILWPLWPEDARAAMAPLWPELVWAFLQVDMEVATVAVGKAGFPAGQAARIVSESLGAGAQGPERGASIELTLRALKKAGVLSLEGTHGFAERLRQSAQVQR